HHHTVSPFPTRRSSDLLTACKVIAKSVLFSRQDTREVNLLRVEHLIKCWSPTLCLLQTCLLIGTRWGDFLHQSVSCLAGGLRGRDRKSTRLNSSHGSIS